MKQFNALAQFIPTFRGSHICTFALLLSFFHGTWNWEFGSCGFSQECGYIYVSPTGASSGTTGTKNNPASFSYGLSLVNSTDKIIRMASGTYNFNSAQNIPSNVTIEGGFNATSWVKSNGTPTIIERDSSNILTNPNRLVGISCTGVSGFRLLDLTVNVADAIGDGVTVYGIYINNCTNYVISRCKVNAGDGSEGIPGATGMQGMNGAGGSPGEPGIEIGDCCRLGGDGGSGSFAGSYTGGKGGTGGKRGGFVVGYYTGFGCPYDTCWYNEVGSDYTNNGLAGLPGTGYGGVPGGNGGVGVFSDQFYQSCQTDSAINYGKPGEPGINGTAGTNGTQGGATYSSGFYMPTTGSIGTNGLPGGAGSGGGGGGGKGGQPAQLDVETGDTLDYDNKPGHDTIPNDSYTSGSGAGGGGGGEGGQGGFTGNGGAGGGASFGIFVWANGINGVVRDCSLNPGTGGQGGTGGTGGTGGIGGSGGMGGNLLNGPCSDPGNCPNIPPGTGTSSCNTGAGGKGGNGGPGGNGGNGGAGSNGVSVSLYQQSGQEPLLVSNMYNPFEPAVTANFSGCSNSEVTFTTTATGNVDWVFGVGANPSSSSGNNVTVQYDSGIPGFRSITLVVEGVPFPLANFINLPTDFTPPEIKTSKDVVCIGDAVNIFTNETATTYDWDIPGGSTSSSNVQSPGNITFSAAGTKTVTLTTTNCCGISVTTKEIDVIASPTVNLGADTSICATDPLPVLDAANPGANFQWTLNGASTGTDTSMLQTNQDGLYAVTVSYGSCSASDSLYLNIYSQMPMNIGADIWICTSDTLPFLDAGVSGMQSYLWTLNFNPVGTNSQTLQTVGAGTYMVSVTSPNGCIGKDTLILTIKDPEIELGNNITICSNEMPPALNAGNPGASYSWTISGTTVGTSQTLQTTIAGTYTVVVTSPSGCTVSDNITLSIVPAMNAAFNVPANGTVGSSVSFADNSSPNPTSWNWNFGDGAPNDFTQNPTHTYNAAGEYPVFLIVNNGTCSDTVITSITIQNNCSTLGLTAAFTLSEDTIYLNTLGMVTLTNTSANSNLWQWDFGDGQTSSAQNPTHVYSDTGTFMITLTAYNYNCSTSVTNYMVVMQYPVAIENLGFQIVDFEIFPNPNDGNFEIRITNRSEIPNYKFLIYNILGETVFSKQPTTDGSSGFNTNNEHLTTNLPTGIFYVKIISEERIFVKKIIITNL